MPSKEKLTFLAKGQNAKGKLFAVGHYVNAWGEDKGYGVWVRAVNYSAGRDVATWRYVQQNLTEEAAFALFDKKTVAATRKRTVAGAAKAGESPRV